MRNRNRSIEIALICLLLFALIGCAEKPDVSAQEDTIAESSRTTSASQPGTAAEVAAEGSGKISEVQEEADTDEMTDAQAAETAWQEFSQDRLFAKDLPDGDLKKPGETIASLEDLIYILDYMAFYRVSDKIWFPVDDAYAQGFYNPYTEYQKAYLMSDLADVYACQMDDSYYSQFGVIGIKYSMSRDIASAAPEKITDTPVVPSFDYERKEPKTEELPIEQANLLEASCENSEQLYYLAMNGYRPVPEPGSKAEELYQAAKEAVFSCTDSSWSDFKKIKGVYDWLSTEIVYDAETAYTSETYLVKEQAYYLEGVFDNHCAVCDGKSKACALMLNMLGIPCYRTTGVNEGGDHAWNMVQLDGKWYILCTTYAQKNRTDSLGRIVPEYSMLLTDKETPYEWYPAQKHPDIEAQLEETAYDIFAQMGEEDSVNLKIDGLKALETLLQQAGQCGKEEYKVEFEYIGDEKESFTEELTAYLEQLGNANAAEVHSKDENVFQVLILRGE